MEKTFETRPCQFKGERIFPGFHRLIRRYLRSSGRILDVGAGNGWMLRQLRDRYPDKEIIGIDLDPQSDDVVRMDVRSLEFPDNRFDLVMCTDVIEHVPDAVLGPGLREICRVLRSGGRFILTTPNEEVLERSLCRCPGCGKVFHQVGHVQTFAAEEVCRRLRESGFGHRLKVRTLHMGGYTLFPRLVTLGMWLRVDAVAPREIREVLNKDLFVVAEKP